MLLEGHQMHGNKWTEIARMVGGRTDNAVKNRHAVLVKKEEQRREDDDAPSREAQARVRRQPRRKQLAKSQARDPVVHPERRVRRKLAPEPLGEDTEQLHGRIEPPDDEFREERAPPSLEELPTSASLTAAEIDLLRQVQELISPRAEGFSLPTSARAGSRGFATTSAATLAPNSPLDTPTVDLQQVMNWIMSVTPRAGGGSGTKATEGKDGGGANASGAGASGSTRATRGAAKNAAETEQGQHSALLRKLLTEKLSGVAPGVAARGWFGIASRCARESHAGGDGPRQRVTGVAELHELGVEPPHERAGRRGRHAHERVDGGINPFGRAVDNLTSPPEGEKERRKKT